MHDVGSGDRAPADARGNAGVHAAPAADASRKIRGPKRERLEDAAREVASRRDSRGYSDAGAASERRAMNSAGTTNLMRTKCALPEFAIDKYNVTNHDFLRFMQAGGYENRSLWSDGGVGVEGEGRRRASDVLETRWKSVDVSHDVWRDPLAAGLAGVREPRGSHGVRQVAGAQAADAKSNFIAPRTERRRAGGTRAIPGARKRRARATAILIFSNGIRRRWERIPRGASAFGVHDLVGNGWEWTRTEFAPFPGFRANALLSRLLREFL